MTVSSPTKCVNLMHCVTSDVSE